MRIFYAADSTPNASINSSLWRHNLYQPLVDLGHDVVEFKYPMTETFRNLDPSDPVQRKFIEQSRPKVTSELLRQVRQAHKEKPINVFFSYFYDACVLPEAIDEIRAMGIVTINWYCNGSYQLHLVSQISPRYDWCLVPEKFRIDDYLRMGAHPIYCQEAANPNIYKPCDVSLEYDVTFVGQAYGERPEYIRYLLDREVCIRVWGYGWENFVDGGPKGQPESICTRYPRILRRLLSLDGQRAVFHRFSNVLYSALNGEKSAHIRLPRAIAGPPLSDDEMIKMYSRSKINLGFSSCGDTHKSGQRILQVRLRDFEVPMSGGFYMVEWMDELEEFYDIGKEVICYRDKDEMVDKIKYFLSHDNEREKIRRAGYERCLRDHTWHKRFQKVFQEIGLA
jgi:spore maturation protein CgeB